MTALKRYLRLEAAGLWRETPEAAPQEVVVSFGKTTLLLTDLRERPLGHWTLGGVREVGTDPDGATVYAMSAGETLTIRDRDMVAAIAAVRRQLPQPQPRRARRRLPAVPILLVALLVGAVARGPDLVRRGTVALVPPEQAAEIGDRMLISLIEAHGPPCSHPDGTRALGLLAASLDPAAPPQLRVMALGTPAVAALPGGTVLIDRGFLATAAPDDLTGALQAALRHDAVAALVRDAGLPSDIRYVFTGHFSERNLALAAESAVAAQTGAGPARAAPIGAPAWTALKAICEAR